MKLNLKLSDKKILILYFIGTFIFTWSFWFGSGILFRKDPVPQIDYVWLLSQVGVFGPSIAAIILTYLFGLSKNRKNILKLGFVYIAMIALGVFIANQNLKDIQDLSLLTVIGVILSAMGIWVYFGLSKETLCSYQKKTKSITKLTRRIVSTALLFPVLFFLGWLVVNSQTGNFSVAEFGEIKYNIFFYLLILFSFDFIYGGAFGEEIGWRGFALPILLKHYSPLKASLALGVFWSLWHLPIDLIHGFGVPGIGGVFIRLIFVCPMSVIFTWIYIHSEKRILSALLLHASVNVLPILKFSNYEIAMSVFVIEMILISFFIVVLDKNFISVPKALETE